MRGRSCSGREFPDESTKAQARDKRRCLHNEGYYTARPLTQAVGWDQHKGRAGKERHTLSDGDVEWYTMWGHAGMGYMCMSPCARVRGVRRRDRSDKRFRGGRSCTLQGIY